MAGAVHGGRPERRTGRRPQHQAALAVWDVRHLPTAAIDVTVVSRGRARRGGIRLHCASSLPEEDRAIQGGLPVTRLPRAVLDFAAVAHPQQLRYVIESADRLERLDHGRLQGLLAAGAGTRKGRRQLREALARIKGPAPWLQSELELSFLTLVREAGLPEPAANVTVHGLRVDFAWLGPHTRPLVVECDGFAFHRDRTRFEDDRARDTHLQTHGIPTIRITQRRLTNGPQALLRDLRALLGLNP
jgi:hypothetical protein